jgi:hypothetical protein
VCSRRWGGHAEGLRGHPGMRCSGNDSAFVTTKLGTLPALTRQLTANHEEPQTHHNSPNRSTTMQAVPDKCRSDAWSRIQLRRSDTNRSGTSIAAKWPPWGISLQRETVVTGFDPAPRWAGEERVGMGGEGGGHGDLATSGVQSRAGRESANRSGIEKHGSPSRT